MIKNRLTVLALMLALSIPFETSAQGGLFQRGALEKESQDAVFLRNNGEGIIVTNQTFGHPVGVDVTNQTFDVPLGSGIITLLMASAGYAFSKTNKRNRKK